MAYSAFLSLILCRMQSCSQSLLYMTPYIFKALGAVADMEVAYPSTQSGVGFGDYLSRPDPMDIGRVHI